MDKNQYITQKDLLRIRSELSEELGAMSPSQRKDYLEAAEDVYKGLSRMAKIREFVKG